MTIKEHRKAFDELYKNESHVDLDFPLEEIDKIDWNRGRHNNGYFNYFYRRFSSHILSKLSLKDGQNILIIGCGLGYDEKNIKYLFRSSKIWSFDISQEMVSRAADNRTPSNLFQGVAERLPFPDNSFDRVLSREVIEHVMGPLDMVCEISRVLKPGGIAVITTENCASLSLSNFYTNHIKKPIARIMRYSINASMFRDEAPSVKEMKTFANSAGITLGESIYDGALYKMIYKFSSVFRSKTPAIAHYFSCLENSPLTGRAFCDQIKFVLVKNTRAGLPGKIEKEPRFVCTYCKGELSIVAKQYFCSQCNRAYPVEDGVPNFIPDKIAAEREESEVQGKDGAPIKSLNNWISAIVFHMLEKSIKLLYVLLYLLFASLCSLFVKKNTDSMSNLMSKSDPYQKHVTIV